MDALNRLKPKMKRILILTFLACGASAMLGLTAQAQSPTPEPMPSRSPGSWAGHKHGGLMQHLTNSLGLSGSQQAEIAPIIAAARPQMKAIQEEAQAKRKALIESVSSQITPLLTPDQQTKFAQMVQRIETRTAGAGAGGGQGGRGFKRAAAGGSPGAAGGKGEVLQRLTSQLGLSADQQAQIKPILEAAHAQVVAIRQNTSLPAEQKFAQIKAAMEAARGQINGILTPAQQQQLDSLRMNFRPGQGRPSASPSP